MGLTVLQLADRLRNEAEYRRTTHALDVAIRVWIDTRRTTHKAQFDLPLLVPLANGVDFLARVGGLKLIAVLLKEAD